MELPEFKKHFVRMELGIGETYGRMLAFVDFGNVNYWFEDDRQDAENRALADDEKLSVSLAGLRDFLLLFARDVRFYYGHDTGKRGSVAFITAAKHVFGKRRVFTKQMQMVRHHLSGREVETNTRDVYSDGDGDFIRIPKCNFDVEISVDAIRRKDDYDTLVLLSGDADFVALARHLRKQGKKVVLIKAGYIARELREGVDLVVNAQRIKRHIASVSKQKPGAGPGLANRDSYPRAGSSTLP